MIPLGYMYKQVCSRPDWLKAAGVEDIYSVSPCISKDFADWVNDWQHNGYWFFDSPDIIELICQKHEISLDGLTLFFYSGYGMQWVEDPGEWVAYAADEAFPVNVSEPTESTVEGYDVVSFSCQNGAECSPLSCNHMAAEIPVNAHCLLGSFEEAKRLVESNVFLHCEPGPYRIIEVRSVGPS